MDADFLDRLAETADELDTLRKATGGLPPELVAKALAWTFSDIAALRAATYEVTE